jgi:hypothetical protein
VSPQFHVKHDDLFEMAGHKVGQFGLRTSCWQALAGFRKGIIRVTKQADPAEKLIKELRRPSSTRKTSINVVDHYPVDDGIPVEGKALVDDMEEATVTI